MPVITHRINDSSSRPALIGLIANFPYKGSVAGAAVKHAIPFAPRSGDGVTPLWPGGLPPGYVVQAVPSTPCVVTIGNKTSKGFDVVLTPLSDAVSIKDGTLDIAILA